MAQRESENMNRSNWELSKENIQPLSSGRKMACLTRSLEASTMAHSETEIKENIREFEEEIIDYTGWDPLEPWIRFITYFEQNCLSHGKFTQKYTSVLSHCVRTFIYQDRQKNDKRFVDVFIKSVGGFQPERRVLLLKNALSNGVGVGVCRMYTAIADEYEKLQKFQAASEVLRNGIAENVQPIDYLEAALTNIQFRVAEMVSKSVREGKDRDCATAVLRSFGASIPCAPTNEAPSIRIALSPANPSKSRPRNDCKKIPVYGGENAENEEVFEQCILPNPVRQLELINSEKENEMNPTKWNNPNTHMESEIITIKPSERIALYSDPDECILPTVSQKVLQRPALSEIKVDPSEVEPSRDQPNAPQLARTSKDSLSVQLPAPPPPTSGNIRMMYRKDKLWCNGREISFEHLRAAEYKKGKLELRRNNEGSTIKVEVSLANNIPNVEIDLKDKRIQQLEAEVKIKTGRNNELLDEKKLLLEEISRLNGNFKIELQLVKAQVIEAYQGDLIRLSRDKSEVLASLHEEKVRRLNFEDEHTKLLEEFQKLVEHDKYASNEVERLKMELKAFQSVSRNTLPRLSEAKFELFADESVYLLQNVANMRPKFDEQNKENMKDGMHDGRLDEKSRRTIVGVLMPSISAEPQALVFENEAEDLKVEPNDTDIILKKNDTEVDFNVSNLTRALSSYPRPLENSTPERKGRTDSAFFDGHHGSLPISGIAPLSLNYESSSLSHATAAQSNAGYVYQRPNFNQTLLNAQNLSTIQETSKENPSGCTTSSSSSNPTGGSTFSCTGNFTRSCSRHQVSHHHQYQ